MTCNKWPGKKSHKAVKDMTVEEHTQHRIYMRSHRNDVNKRKREAFVGPLPKRKLWFVGPPRPHKKRSTKGQRNKMRRASKTLSDYFIKRKLKRMFRRMGVETSPTDFSPEVIELKRQQLKLWRMAHA